MARHDLSDLSDADLARLLGAKGRHGDTQVVHVNPQEISLLKMLGGSGTRNPKTGLLEFFAGGPGGVGRDGGGAVAGGASGIGGRGASGNGGSGKGARNDSKQGTAAAGATQGHLGAGYGSGSQTGLSQGDIDKMVTGGDFSAPGGPTTKRGIIGNGDLNHDPYGRSTLGILGDIAMGAYKGMGLGSTIGTLGGPAGSLVGGATGLVAGGIYGGLNGGMPDGMTQGANHDPSKSTSGGGPSSGGIGGNDGGIGAGRGDSLPGDHTSVAQNAQQANAGGGLIAALNPAAAPTTPGLPAGLLQYLAANPGLLQGLVSNSRFGTGTVAPFNYGQPLA